MKVNVRLFATLRIDREKDMTMDLPEAAIVRDVIGSLAISERDAAIIFINGRGVKLDQMLSDGDRLSIFPLVGGG